MKRFYLTLLFICLVGFSVSFAQRLTYKSEFDKVVSQFDKLTWVVYLDENLKNPYDQSEGELNLIITNSENSKAKVPCYFVQRDKLGKTEWRAHFSPSKSGHYNFNFEFENKEKHTSSKTKQGEFEVKSSRKKGFLLPYSDYGFKFSDGTLFRGLGENICWEARSYDDSKYFKALHENPKFNYNYMFKKLSRNGGNFARVWMCAWNFPLDNNIVINTNRYQNSTEYFNLSAVNKLDSMFQLADSLGIYIMLTLDHAGTYIGQDWDRNNYNLKNGGYASTANEFFVNEKSKNQYKNKLRYLIARYGSYSSLACWEFFNEVDNLMFASNDSSKYIKAQDVVAWHKEMSGYLKNTDPYKHLVSTSVSHRDINGLNEISTIDFNQKHVYKYTLGIPTIIQEYTSKYKKAYVIGEYGYEWDWSKNFNEFSLEMDSDFKRGLWLGLFSNTPILPLSWWWEYFEDRGLIEYFSSVKYIMNVMLDYSAKDLLAVQDWSIDTKDVLLKVVGNSNVKFVYLFNQTNRPVKFSKVLPLKKSQKVKVEIYDCEKAKIDGILELKEFNGYWKISDLELGLLQDKVLIIKNE